MKTSVYTSLFNYSPDKFDIADTFNNWSKYSDEIVIATFPDQKEKLEYIFFSQIPNADFNYRIVSCDTSLEDPLFDGKLKNAALQACSHNTVIQQDFDERISGDIEQWDYLKRRIYDYSFPVACMVPVIDLYKDLNHYKGINQKWYLHQKEGCFRGPVYFAKKQGGGLDVTKSDSCELINSRDELIPSFADRRFIDYLDIKYPLIVHLGYLDLNKRAENNKFWGPIWSARNGSKVEVATDIETLEKENKAIPHNFKPEWWK